MWETAADVSLVSLLPDKRVRSLLAVPDALSLLCARCQRARRSHFCDRRPLWRGLFVIPHIGCRCLNDGRLVAVFMPVS